MAGLTGIQAELGRSSALYTRLGSLTQIRVYASHLPLVLPPADWMLGDRMEHVGGRITGESEAGGGSFSKMCCCQLSGIFDGLSRSVARSCPTLGDPMKCSPPGSSVRGIFRARILEGVDISSSMGSSPPKNQTCLLHCRWILYQLSH